VSVRFVIVGGGPAGQQAATYAARLGAKVTVIERDVIGGAAHLWDCIPSKTMIATGGAMSFSRRIGGMGLEQSEPEIAIEALKSRIESIKSHLQKNATTLLESQGVRIVHGAARFTGPNTVVVDGVAGTEAIEFDAALVSTGSRPRIPDWCQPDGDRILTTRDCYPPKVIPESITVIGSGVTGVEFVHMFESFGSKVTLVVSRQQVLPGKDPEVAAVLEDDFLKRGVKLLKGARAESIERDGDAPFAPRTPCWRSARYPTPTPSILRLLASKSIRAVTSRSRTTAPRTNRTSTPPATSAASCRCHRSHRCRAARSPST
jgi:pyruvate/2-oxoglutarate dehydrogenase complex dihydrolipoamide dehydrogenase (E3) component